MRFDDEDDDDFRSSKKKKKTHERGKRDEFPEVSFGQGFESPKRDFGDKSFGDRPPRRDFGDRSFGDRPPRTDFGDRPPRRDFGDRPPRQDFGDRPPRRDFGDRPPRRDFGDRPPRQDFGDRPPRRDFGDRPPRRDFGDRPPRNDAPREDLPIIEGVVKFYNGERGFGFVSPQGGGEDVFIHISALQRAGIEKLEPNQKVSFQLLPDKFGKGPKAIKIKLLD